MKRTPEQEAARKERRRREATYQKCPCGNIAGVGETYCGACRPAVEEKSERVLRILEIRSDLRCGLYPAALDKIVDMLEEII